MNRLTEINHRLKELHSEKEQLLSCEAAKKEEHIKKLEWTKDCLGVLYIDSYAGLGSPIYTIVISGKDIPSTAKPIKIMGDDKSCDRNLLFGRSYSHDNYHAFYTNNAKLLCKFLSIVKFKTLQFNNDHLNVLKTAEQYHT